MTFQKVHVGLGLAAAVLCLIVINAGFMRSMQRRITALEIGQSDLTTSIQFVANQNALRLPAAEADIAANRREIDRLIRAADAMSATMPARGQVAEILDLYPEGRTWRKLEAPSRDKTTP